MSFYMFYHVKNICFLGSTQLHIESEKPYYPSEEKYIYKNWTESVYNYHLSLIPSSKDSSET